MTTLLAVPALLLMYLMSQTVGSPLGRDDGFFGNANTSEPVQFMVNKKYLTGHADGIVNGSEDSTHDSVWKRYAVRYEQVVLKNVQHCMFVCINDCGYTYLAKTPNAECLFHENLTANYYTNFYRRNETLHETLYLAMNSKGHTRRTIVTEQDSLVKVKVFVLGVITRWSNVEPLDLCAPMSALKSKLDYKPKKSCDVVTPKRRDARLMSNDVPLMPHADIINLSEKVNGAAGNVDDNNHYMQLTSGAKKKNSYKIQQQPPVDILLLPSNANDKPYLLGASDSKENHSVEQKQTTVNPLDVTIKIDIDNVVENLLNKRKLHSDGNFANASVTFISNYSFKDCKFIQN
ncbi:fibroblast growth factor [Orgyia leucostigma nucleopolyhedrovirus]|uniref:Fibroblast growth factor n=1 Tax=Orgyia leucostigma nucleopolyhedrovirus TaxID=490711 RepID=B0FDZ3_9ABAC|nr:fibroblast growth factor [Orgyia leucostigma nucleopolyhedrovirus]ABY65851.1 fibroblast growth factor [Orgyia leucostigma nucleopolyhedrovirus]